jgi:hypothetical protein
MALFGKDFSESRPTDADFVKHTTSSKTGAAVIRTLKQTIKDFFSVMMNLETGGFNANSIPNSALEPLSPNPEGTFREVSVTKKGLVFDGEEEPEGEPKYHLRAFLSADENFQSIQETREGSFVNLPFVGGVRYTHQNTSDKGYDGYIPPTGGTGGFNFRTIDFFVPDRVTEVKYTIWQPYSTTYNTKGSHRIGTISVSSGMRIRVILGIDDGFVVAILGTRLRVGDYSKNIGTYSDTVDHTPTVSHTNYFKQSNTNYGDSPYSGPAKYVTPGFGFCMLEWFEV